MNKIDWPKLIGSLVITLGAGWLGSSLTRPNNSWYANINRTVLTPPNWLFAPVWTILFCLMAAALYIIWSGRNKKKTRKKAVQLYFGQLAANIAWSGIFFGLQSISLAFIEIVFLLILITYCLVAFSRINRAAGYLMLPYFLWVCFATVLNLSLWLIN
ncbi:MAG TPA: tryptophan-rich sensory protein [bacterium]|jgi:tryptophan-rich sensory protein|nr:tryptophan-rich sensory protein [bacterium]HOQ91735.1 tryptophan-rich sensory protein [bacterium]HPL22319.1 tryptophan-rich sensory protein [bacterium]